MTGVPLVDVSLDFQDTLLIASIIFLLTLAALIPMKDSSKKFFIPLLVTLLVTPTVAKFIESYLSVEETAVNIAEHYQVVLPDDFRLPDNNASTFTPYAATHDDEVLTGVMLERHDDVFVLKTAQRVDGVQTFVEYEPQDS